MIRAAAEKEFSLWLTTQTNARGLPYKAHVANRYAACLRTEPLKLDIPLSTEERDTYRCRTLQDFDRLIKLFRAAPNFQKVDRGSGHGTFSAGLSAYRRYVCFLESGVEEVFPSTIDTPEILISNENCYNLSKQLDVTIPDVILDVLRSTYSGGFRFEATSISLLAGISGIQIDTKIKENLENSMFGRRDGIFFLPDQIADEETQTDLLVTTDAYLQNYGCFEVSEVYKEFEKRLNPACIKTVEDFEDYAGDCTKANAFCQSRNVPGRQSRLFNIYSMRLMITSQIEHHAVLNVCLSIERLGIPVRRLPVNQEGIVESEAFQTSISDQTKLVSVMLANNEIGTVEPISALAEIAHQHGALFHTDAVQAVGHIPVDVKALGVDLLSASGHKFNGPKGVGFLYIKKGTEIQPYANGGGQESGIRAGTENIASIVAMACALRKNCDRMITVSERLSRMEHIFIHTLNQAGIDYIRNGADNHIPGNINISIRDANGESLLHRLDLKGICISTGSACDSVNTKVSHVIQAIGIPKEYAQGTIRISFGADNIETDASEVATALIEILRK